MRLAGALFLCLSILTIRGSPLAADESRNAVPVRFAILFDKGDPIAGVATCTLGMHCQIFQSQIPLMDVYLDIHRKDDRILGRIEVDCSEGCSFSDGRKSREFGDECQFDFYEGTEMIERWPVLRPQNRIGRILLNPLDCQSGGFELSSGTTSL
jgi:hypothetical protein